MMKILAVYASAGAGHQKAAEAIFNYLKDNRQDLTVKIIDLLDYSNCLLRFTYRKGYSWVVNYAPWVWGLAYWITYRQPFSFIFKWLNTIFDIFLNRKLLRVFLTENPDYIISPHFLPPEIAGYLKKKKSIKSKIITIITDLGIHPYWISKETDLYAVHSDYAARQLLKRGIPKEKIISCGIPVGDKFLKEYSRKEVAARLNLSPDRFTVLIATGSFGLGPIEKLIVLLQEEVQILVVCARNARLYRRIAVKNYDQVKVFGFVDNMQELMACSDVMLTKAGGLTVTECLAMRLVPLFITAIPGQETQNIKVIVSEQAGMDIRYFSAYQIKNIILDFKDNPVKLSRIRNNMQFLRKPSATGDLCRAVC